MWVRCRGTCGSCCLYLQVEAMMRDKEGELCMDA